MRTRKSATCVILTLLSLLCSLLVAMPARAETTGCMPNIGKKVPVVLVHGLLGKGSDWDSFKDYLHGQSSDIMAEAFDYSAYNTQWVTNPNIGAALADRIACMAAASRQQSGQGKVIAIAHSMGGLAIREAIAERPAILQDLGMAVTIATPNTGSDIAAKGTNLVKDLCVAAPVCTAGLIVALNQLNAVAGLKTGSSEIKALPGWPKTLPVQAFAGNITPHYNLFGWEFNGFPSNSDTLVTVPSALHEVKVNGLGGSETFTCVGRPAPVLPNWTKADCEHAALLNNAALRAGVVKAIGGYVAKKTVKPSVSKSAAVAPCLTASQAEVMLNKALAEHASITGDEAPVAHIASVKCFDKWAVSHDNDKSVAVFEFNSSSKKWTYVSTLGAGGADHYCEHGVPAEVLKEVGYRCS